MRIPIMFSNSFYAKLSFKQHVFCMYKDQFLSLVIFCSAMYAVGHVVCLKQECSHGRGLICPHFYGPKTILAMRAFLPQRAVSDSVKVKGRYFFQLFSGLKVMECHIFQLLEALQVTKSYFFTFLLFSVLKVTRLCIFQLFSVLQIIKHYFSYCLRH